MIDNYISGVFVIVVNHVGFICQLFYWFDYTNKNKINHTNNTKVKYFDTLFYIIKVL